jgi:hypothetical protein
MKFPVEFSTAATEFSLHCASNLLSAFFSTRRTVISVVALGDHVSDSQKTMGLLSYRDN